VEGALGRRGGEGEGDVPRMAMSFCTFLRYSITDDGDGDEVTRSISMISS